MSPDLKRGVAVAIFHLKGIRVFSKERLIICVKWEARVAKASFKIVDNRPLIADDLLILIKSQN